MAVVLTVRDAHGYPAMAYDCAGCRERHVLRLRGTSVPEPTWIWNGNPDAPTFHPAVRTADCHHQVRDGKLIFLSSSPHVMAGQAIEMREL